MTKSAESSRRSSLSGSSPGAVVDVALLHADLDSESFSSGTERLTKFNSSPTLEVTAVRSNSSEWEAYATPNTRSSDTDSIRTFGSERTLVESSNLSGEVPPQKPLTHNLLTVPAATRHKHTCTCSSLDSEGLGSLTSEEVAMEETETQDWTQLSKEVKNKLPITD